MKPWLFRTFILAFVLLLLTLFWYFCFEKTALIQMKTHRHLKEQRQEMLLQLQTLSQLRKEYVYADDLVSSSVQDMLQGLATSTGGLVMTDFIDEGRQLISSGGERFTLAAQAANIHLFPQLTQHTVTVTLKGSFIYFLRYLQALQQDPRRLYIQSVDFTMKVYPKAEIVLTVFTLEAP